MANKIRYVGPVFIIIFAYALGLVTAQYKIFPYHELRSIKRMVIGDTNAKASSKNRHSFNASPYYEYKMLFIAEHGRQAEIVMLGDSMTDVADWSDLFPSVEIADQGISGDTTIGVLNRLNLVIDATPSKVFIMIGVNDFMKGKNSDEIFIYYRIIINRLVQNNIHTYIQSTLLVGEDKDKEKNVNDKIVDLNNELKILAEENELVTYINLYSQLAKDGYLNTEYSQEGKMLNGKGYGVWRDTIKPYIL